jgi:anti-anti-sigma regulatory factor
MFASLLSRWFSRLVLRRARVAGHGPGSEATAGRRAAGLVIRVRGDAGPRQAGPLLAALLAPAAMRAPVVTLDLSGLRSVSRLALSVLASYRRSVLRRGGRLRLLPGLQPRTRASFEGAGLLELFADGGEAAPSRQAALAG